MQEYALEVSLITVSRAHFQQTTPRPDDQYPSFGG